MSDTPRHSVSVAAAILDDSGKRILLIKRRDNGHWEPPGGVLELDETVEDGLRREVREETGAEILVGPLTGVYKNMKAGIVSLVFRGNLISTPATSTAEAAAVQWHPLADADVLMTPAYAIRVSDAASGGPPLARSHDGTTLCT